MQNKPIAALVAYFLCCLLVAFGASTRANGQDKQKSFDELFMDVPHSFLGGFGSARTFNDQAFLVINSATHQLVLRCRTSSEDLRYLENFLKGDDKETRARAYYLAQLVGFQALDSIVSASTGNQIPVIRHGEAGLPLMSAVVGIPNLKIVVLPDQRLHLNNTELEQFVVEKTNNDELTKGQVFKLWKLLKSKNRDLRYFAEETLQMAQERIKLLLPTLLEKISDPNVLPTTQLAFELLLVLREEAQPAMVKLGNHSSAVVRKRAFEFLDAVKVRGPEVEQLLANGLKDESSDVRRLAATNLLRHFRNHEGAIEVIQNGLNTKGDIDLRERYCSSLSQLGSQASSLVELATQCLRKEWPDTHKMSLLRFLGRNKSAAKEALPLIRDILNSNSHAIYKHALESQLAISNDSKESIRIAIDILDRKNVSFRHKTQVLSFIGRFESDAKDVLPSVYQLALDTTSPDLTEANAKSRQSMLNGVSVVMVKIGKESQPWLDKLSNNPNQNIQRLVERTKKRIQ